MPACARDSDGALTISVVAVVGSQKLTEQQFPNGEDKFGQYLQYIRDEAEESDALHVKAYTFY